MALNYKSTVGYCNIICCERAVFVPEQEEEKEKKQLKMVLL